MGIYLSTESCAETTGQHAAIRHGAAIPMQKICISPHSQGMCTWKGKPQRSDVGNPGDRAKWMGRIRPIRLSPVLGLAQNCTAPGGRPGMETDSGRHSCSPGHRSRSSLLPASATCGPISTGLLVRRQRCNDGTSVKGRAEERKAPR